MLSTVELKSVALGVVVVSGVLLTACGPGSSVLNAAGSSTSSAKPTAASSQADAAQQLDSTAHGQPHAVVTLPDGSYQGATVNSAGKVSFWHYANAKWNDIGDATYPVLGSTHSTPTVKGQLLPGMKNGTYILDGDFSNDSTANAAAYTADKDGRWGAIGIAATPEHNLVPSGAGPQDDGAGLFDGLYFAGNELETADCSENLPSAECGGNNRILKYWQWSAGSDSFVLVRTGGLSH